MIKFGGFLDNHEEFNPTWAIWQETPQDISAICQIHYRGSLKRLQGFLGLFNRITSQQILVI